MASYRLPYGREISLVRLKIVRTYEGWLEGSPHTVSQVILQNLSKRVARLLPPADPLVAIAPPPGELPPWLCVAELESSQGVNPASSDHNSRLYVCWFMTNTAWGMDEMMEKILQRLDWDGSAKDYDIMDF